VFLGRTLTSEGPQQNPMATTSHLCTILSCFFLSFQLYVTLFFRTYENLSCSMLVISVCVCVFLLAKAGAHEDLFIGAGEQVPIFRRKVRLLPSC
jgi:hypothetical protein